jgi:hypothetical protein
MAQQVANIYLADEIAGAAAARQAATVPDATEQEEEAPADPPFDPASVQLEEYVGVYYSPELETMYTLVVEGDSLVARHIRHEPATFTPDAPDRFTGSQFYLRQVVFERDERGKITGLRVSNGRVRHLLFEKRGH